MIEIKLTEQELKYLIVSVFYVRLTDNLQKEDEKRLKDLQKYLEMVNRRLDKCV